MPHHHGDLPAALLGAVEDAVNDVGVSGVSLRDVAWRAGVSRSAPAHHPGCGRDLPEVACSQCRSSAWLTGRAADRQF